MEESIAEANGRLDAEGSQGAQKTPGTRTYHLTERLRSAFSPKNKNYVYTKTAHECSSSSADNGRNWNPLSCPFEAERLPGPQHVRATGTPGARERRAVNN